MPRAILSLFLIVLALPAADIFEQQRRLGRGVNMGNSFEAPTEAAWGHVIQDEDFSRIKAAGFNSVRIPTKWSAHAAKEAPYAIDPVFMARVEHVVKTALAAGLQVILNVHHYDEIDQEPAKHRERFTALWHQISARFATLPDNLQFELYNEPNTNHSAEEWNLNLAAALKEVRATNPTRAVHIGGVKWNQVHTLKDLKLPPEDRNIIVHIHYYSPFHFTHKNASWVKGSKEWKDGDTWTGTEAEKAAVLKDFAIARDWAKQAGRPVFLGEFGSALSHPDAASRLRWTRFIRDSAEAHGFTWTYWEYQANFGVWNPQAKEWRKDMLEALTGK